MKVNKKTIIEKKSNKIIAELHISFMKDNKSYQNYFVGSIKYIDGNYEIIPTNADDFYSEEEKYTILENTLKPTTFFNQQTQKYEEIDKSNPDFLQIISDSFGNMYSGLSIVNEDELKAHSDKLNKNLNKINKKPSLKVNKSKNIDN
jgi:hypothetical protein